MDSGRTTCQVNDEEIEDKMQDNRQFARDPGRRDEMDENGQKSSLIMEIYPWILQFKKMCRNSLAQRSMSSLKTLMTFYRRNVRSSVNECRTKPLRAEKLKECIAETLLFFLYYYRDVGESKDRDDYLIVMSDLLAMYIDMELKASKKGKEHCSKISSRLSSCLHVYLDHSAEHLLDTLLKVHFMTHNYHEILEPVITKIFKSIDEHPSSSIMYVRYLLAYRLWKKLNKDVAVRNQINVIALTSLGTAPVDFSPFIVESVLPQVPKTQKISTKLLLIQKFEVEKSCEEFLNFCNKERELKWARIEDETCLTSAINSLPEDINDKRELIKNNNDLSTVSSQVTSLVVNSSLNETNLENSKVRRSVVKKVIPSNLSSLRRQKRSNDIVFIDLTSDSVEEKVIRNKKKTRRKLIWLEEVVKRVSTKIIGKKDSPIEDNKQPEDLLDLQSLRISGSKSPSSKMEIIAERVNGETEDVTREERIIVKDSSQVLSIETPDETSRIVTNSLVNKSPGNVESSGLESQNNEKNHVKGEEKEEEEKEEENNSAEEREMEVSPGVAEVSPIWEERSTLGTSNFSPDQYSREKKIDDDARESTTRDDDADVVETSEMLHDSVETLAVIKTPVTCNAPVPPAIKPEHVSVQPSEITNETITSSDLEIHVPEYASEVSISCDEPSEHCQAREVEYQENIDGLSLLASVSQRISHLTTANPPVELIKVKNYASLANLEEVAEKPDDSREALPLNGDTQIGVINRIIGIYPEDAMDKVAYQVEVTSTDEIDPYESCDRTNELSNFSCNDEVARFNPQSTSNPIVPVESTTLLDKDEGNVILNGETVVLFQKSPNSNLYIINKAVENRDHANDEIINGHMSEHVNDSGAYSYEIYDSIYRNQASSYDIKQYNRDLSGQESRRAAKMKPDQAGEASKGCDSLEISKSAKTKGLEVLDGKARIKRKTNGLPGRRRIKQEYNGCARDISGHVKSNYGIQDCPQEHADVNRSIHIPVAHAAPIYTKYPSGTELCLPCHKSCNSIACGLSVNAAPALHPGKSTGNSPRCSCLNCTYGIVTHCSECIRSSGETRGTTIDPNSYYLPMHPGQNSNVQDCNGTSVDGKLDNIYNDQLVCKFEQTIMDRKPLESVKYETTEIYRAELDNKLPLKKRFKAIMSMSFVDNVPIKREKIQSYPGTPMLSIAALEGDQDNTANSTDSTSRDKSLLDLTGKNGSRGETRGSHQSREILGRDYRKDTMMSSLQPPPAVPASSQNGNSLGNSAKRKRRASQNPQETSNEVNNERSSKTGVTGCKRGTTTPTKSQARPSDKVKEPDTVIQTKNSTRKTRSSKRNVPKVNYIYTDADSDWNPSGGIAGENISKRKRKRTSR